MPALFVIEILPVVAPFGTVTEIEAIELTVNVAALPFIFTEVIPEKLEPIIVITVWANTLPVAGVKLLIVGKANLIAGQPANLIVEVLVCEVVVQIGLAVTTGLRKVNEAVLVDAGLKLRVFKVILPLVAEVGAFATIWPLTSENVWASIPLNLTAVTNSGELV